MRYTNNNNNNNNNNSNNKITMNNRIKSLLLELRNSLR